MDGIPGPLHLPRLRRPHSRINSNSDSLIVRNRPAPGSLLRLLPFSENSLVADLPSGGEGSSATELLWSVPSWICYEPQWEKRRQPHAGSSGNKATSCRNFVNLNEDLLSTLHTNADGCRRPAIGRMRSRFNHFRDIGSASSIGIMPSGDSHC